MDQPAAAPAWQLLPVADHAVYIDFGEVIDEQINRRVTALAARLKAAAPAGITSLIPTYRSLTVNYDSTQVRQQALIQQLEQLLAETVEADAPSKCWHIPVCYGGQYGIDLPELAATHGLSEQEAIAIHSATRYRVYMIGFMPGFAYLGGLDARLHTPRRVEPRLKVPAGSISIGGMQTAVGSVAAPSGWHLLGRTPVRSFDPTRESPFLLQAGDNVHFFTISERQFEQLSAERHYLPEWSWQT